MINLILTCLDENYSKTLCPLNFFSFYLEKLNFDDSVYGKARFPYFKFANSKCLFICK